jgi:amidase
VRRRNGDAGVDLADGGDDPVGAFVPGPRAKVAGEPGGDLAGRTVTVKDVIDVAGAVTGAGNPTWAATHTPASAHAPAVTRLLGAGVSVVGKGACAEFAYSLSGDNAHYGMPVNTAAPDRNPGGSTSGPAAAVAAGLSDLGLGTDTLGSIRIPASYCGLVGYRPTHGAISLAGVLPLAASFDTVGLLATDGAVLARAAEVLTGMASSEEPVRAVRLVTDARGRVEPTVWASVAAAAAAVAGSLDCPLEPVHLFDGPGAFDRALTAFSDIQSTEVWRAYGPWIEANHPDFGPGVGERFAHAATVTDAARDAAEQVRPVIVDPIVRALGDGALVALPSAGLPPPRSAGPDELQAARVAAGGFSSLAGLGRVPAVSIPAHPVDGAPVGLTLLAARGADALVLRAAVASGRPRANE